MIQIDGSWGEGGGQILRSSLALSLLTQQPFSLRNIRANRPKPGLQPQHLMSVRAAAQISSATVHGAALSSRELVFRPSPVCGGSYRFAIGTAGATGLVLHTVFLPLALRAACSSSLELAGGTHVTASPCFHFLATTWCGYLRLLGLDIGLSLERTGFYPRGGGQVQAVIAPAETVRSLNMLERPELTQVHGFSAAAGLPVHVAQRQARRATQRLRAQGFDVSISEEQWPGGPGSVLALVWPQNAVPTMFVSLGARGKSAEAVADEAVDEALAFWRAGAPVDPHSADQLLLPLAFAPGESTVRVSEVTRHLTTNLAIIRQFVERDISVDAPEGSAGVVRIAALRV